MRIHKVKFARPFYYWKKRKGCDLVLTWLFDIRWDEPEKAIDFGQRNKVKVIDLNKSILR